MEYGGSGSHEGAQNSLRVSLTVLWLRDELYVFKKRPTETYWRTAAVELRGVRDTRGRTLLGRE